MAPTPAGSWAQPPSEINVVRAGVNYHFNWRPGSGCCQVLIGGKLILKKARPSRPGFFA